MVHEFSHVLFCLIMNVRIYKVCYFQLKNPAGYVEHQAPRNFIQAFFISVGPLLFGSFFSLLLFSFDIYFLKNFQFSIFNFITIILAMWFGVTIAINSFPSDGDAKVLLSETNHHVFKKINPFALIIYPIILIIKVANYLRRFYFDWIYATFLLLSAYLLLK